MSASIITVIFLLALSASAALQAWLSWRQRRCVGQHRGTVPPAFTKQISLAAHQKAADYTVAKSHIAMIELALSVVWVVFLTIGGGLQGLNDIAQQRLPSSGLWQGVALFGLLSVCGFMYELPVTLYRTFNLEARFGFNRMTAKLFLQDLFKQTLLTLCIGAPLLWVVLWIMQSMGSLWWLWVWAFWLGFSLLAMVVFPLWIAPLFNKFAPLEDVNLKARIEALLTRCGFRAKGLFVMDGSRRSAHGNAYFTGLGASKRIVFFDTLLKSLSPAETEAVLAHELGHFKHHHLWQRMLVMSGLMLALLALLGWLMQQVAFYQGLGIQTAQPGSAIALILFSLLLPPFLLPLTPLGSYWSRRHEFEADAYAAQQANASDLISALVKLYEDNASTLTPDPLHSLFYDSHPPAAIRIGRLQQC